MTSDAGVGDRCLGDAVPSLDNVKKGCAVHERMLSQLGLDACHRAFAGGGTRLLLTLVGVSWPQRSEAWPHAVGRTRLLWCRYFDRRDLGLDVASNAALQAPLRQRRWAAEDRRVGAPAMSDDRGRHHRIYR